MANRQKQLSAKAAWARMTAANRLMREALLRILQIVGRRRRNAQESETALREVEAVATTALQSDDEQKAA